MGWNHQPVLFWCRNRGQEVTFPSQVTQAVQETWADTWEQKLLSFPVTRDQPTLPETNSSHLEMKASSQKETRWN